MYAASVHILIIWQSWSNSFGLQALPDLEYFFFKVHHRKCFHACLHLCVSLADHLASENFVFRVVEAKRYVLMKC